MGDRCHMEITLRGDAENLRKFGEALKWSAQIVLDPLDPPNDSCGCGCGTLVIDEANYALQIELDTAAKAGLEFFGWHGEGGSYPAEDFVTDRGKVLYRRTSDREHVANVRLRKDGTPFVPASELKAIQKMERITTQLRKKWGIK